MMAMIVIQPTAVFRRPIPIIAGYLIASSDRIPFGERLFLYNASGLVKQVTLLTEITTSPESWRAGLYGYTYSGDVLEDGDISAEALLTDLSYAQARQIWMDKRQD
ncbi:hypothetical protein HC891_20180 [Candidatus Gracilibacteria bacterium]|nr:hypothetical protein [Candidatus Gracilibacteria bacterium]